MKNSQFPKRALILFLGLALSIALFAGCGKKAAPEATQPERSANPTESKAPYSKGPTGPPKIGAPTAPFPE